MLKIISFNTSTHVDLPFVPVIPIILGKGVSLELVKNIVGATVVIFGLTEMLPSWSMTRMNRSGPAFLDLWRENFENGSL